MSLLDLPFSISPVVTGLMLTLLYGRTGWFAALLRETGINVVFAFTGGALCLWGGKKWCGHWAGMGEGEGEGELRC